MIKLDGWDILAMTWRRIALMLGGVVVLCALAFIASDCDQEPAPAMERCR